MRKVTIVVPVLMASCQVSLKPNIGPLTIHAAMTATASVNTRGRPQKWEAALANREYIEAERMRNLSWGRGGVAGVDVPVRFTELGG